MIEQIPIIVIVSLRVSPLLAYVLSHLDIVLFLFASMLQPVASLSNLTTASLLLYTLGGIAK